MPSCCKPELIGTVDCFPIWDEAEDIEFIQDVRELVDGSPHSMALKIPLRSPVKIGESAEELYESWFGRTDTEDTLYAESMPSTMKTVSNLMTELGYSDVYRVMLVMLPPNSEITPHADEGVYSNHVDRYHLVIGGDCTWNGGSMTVGNLYKVPHLQTHHVVAGDIGRTALIMDFS